jgi:polar amino acid transport system substrate-binding protein
MDRCAMARRLKGCSGKWEVYNLKMKKFIGLSLVAITLLALVLVISGCTSLTPTAVPNVTATPAPIKTITPNVIKVATEAAWAPFEWINSSDSDPQRAFVGFGMDLMRAIANKMNYTVQFTDQPFSGIMTAVQGGTFDLGISSFSVTPERQNSIDFSDPYYQIQQVILIRKNDTSITGADDLKNKSKLIGAQSGTMGEATAKELVGAANETRVKTYEHVTDVFPALQAGQIDAIINDYPVSQYYADQCPGQFVFVGKLFRTKEPYAMVISKTNTGLTKAINDALASLKADGSYDALLKKYNLDKVPV